MFTEESKAFAAVRRCRYHVPEGLKDGGPVSEAEMAEQRRDALVNELFKKIIGAMEVATVYLGDRLGLY
jgi:hypothetical protein